MLKRLLTKTNVTFITIGLAAIASIGSFWAACETRRAATASVESLALEVSPALQLDCNLDHKGRQPSLPTHILFLRRQQNVLVQLSEFPISGDDGRKFDLPYTFFRCTLTNYGKMPAFNIAIRFPVEYGNLNDASQPEKTELAFFDLPALGSGSSHEFAIADWDTQFYARVTAPESVEYSTPSRTINGKYTLFLSRWATATASGQLPPVKGF